MNERSAGDHLMPDELSNYFAGKLPEEKQFTLEEHLAECAACCEQARRVYSFTTLLESWTTKETAVAGLSDILSRALQSACEGAADPAWRERLRGWREAWGGRAEGAVRVVLDAPSKTARILTDGLDELLRPAAAWQFTPEPVSAANFVRGPLEAQSIALVSAPGIPRVRVCASGSLAELEVRIDDLPQKYYPPLIVLIPTSGTSDPRVGELTRPPGVPYWIARFQKLEPGEYLVVFEPIR